MLQHSTKKKLVEVTKHSLDEEQSKLQFTYESGRKSTSRAILLTFPGDDSLKTEILWLLKLAVSNFSLSSTDKLGGLFQTMFPDSKIAAGFTPSQTKSSYVISHGLSQYFTHMLVKDLLKSELHFCLHFDETTTTTYLRKLMNSSSMTTLISQVSWILAHAAFTLFTMLLVKAWNSMEKV